MPYISLDNLTRYDGKIKEYAEDTFAPADAMNWQKTEAAGAVSFYPVPETVLEPVVDFLFTETEPAEGTKAPDNPSTITGVSSVTVTHCETTGIDSTDYTIQLGNTYYGGTLDVASGVMTVTWVGVVYNGTENITKMNDLADGTPQYNLPVPSYRVIGGSEGESGTHFSFGYTANKGYVRGVGGIGYRVYATGYDTLESFVSFVSAQYAAGTPLTVVYKVATPYTVQLTPTQILSLSQPDPYVPRVNTVYSDQTSVQVGYPKSPQATALELTNAVISLGGNI